MKQPMKAIWKGQEYSIGYINFIVKRIQIAVIENDVCYFAKEVALNDVKLEFGEADYPKKVNNHETINKTAKKSAK